MGEVRFCASTELVEHGNRYAESMLNPQYGRDFSPVEKERRAVFLVLGDVFNHTLNAEVRS